MKKECIERLELAVGQDRSIICTREQVGNHAGNDPKYLAELGLEEKHLRRLQKLGIAFKAYTKNIWLPGETLPNGKVEPAGSTSRGSGTRVRWLLVQKES